MAANIFCFEQLIFQIPAANANKHISDVVNQFYFRHFRGYRGYRCESQQFILEELYTKFNG